MWFVRSCCCWWVGCFVFLVLCFAFVLFLCCCLLWGISLKGQLTRCCVVDVKIECLLATISIPEIRYGVRVFFLRSKTMIRCLELL